jgi:hypothetical protein
MPNMVASAVTSVGLRKFGYQHAEAQQPQFSTCENPQFAPLSSQTPDEQVLSPADWKYWHVADNMTVFRVVLPAGSNVNQRLESEFCVCHGISVRACQLLLSKTGFYLPFDNMAYPYPLAVNVELDGCRTQVLVFHDDQGNQTQYMLYFDEFDTVPDLAAAVCSKLRLARGGSECETMENNLAQRIHLADYKIRRFNAQCIAQPSLGGNIPHFAPSRCRAAAIRRLMAPAAVTSNAGEAAAIKSRHAQHWSTGTPPPRCEPEDRDASALPRSTVRCATAYGSPSGSCVFTDVYLHTPLDAAENPIGGRSRWFLLGPDEPESNFLVPPAAPWGGIDGLWDLHLSTASEHIAGTSVGAPRQLFQPTVVSQPQLRELRRTHSTTAPDPASARAADAMLSITGLRLLLQRRYPYNSGHMLMDGVLPLFHAAQMLIPNATDDTQVLFTARDDQMHKYAYDDRMMLLSRRPPLYADEVDAFMCPPGRWCRLQQLIVGVGGMGLHLDFPPSQRQARASLHSSFRQFLQQRIPRMPVPHPARVQVHHPRFTDCTPGDGGGDTEVSDGLPCFWRRGCSSASVSAAPYCAVSASGTGTGAVITLIQRSDARAIPNMPEIEARISVQYPQAEVRAVFLELMPLAVQVRMFLHTTILVALEGTSLDNVLLMREGGGLVLFARRDAAAPGRFHKGGFPHARYIEGIWSQQFCVRTIAPEEDAANATTAGHQQSPSRVIAALAQVSECIAAGTAGCAKL